MCYVLSGRVWSWVYTISCLFCSSNCKLLLIYFLASCPVSVKFSEPFFLVTHPKHFKLSFSNYYQHFLCSPHPTFLFKTLLLPHEQKTGYIKKEKKLFQCSNSGKSLDFKHWFLRLAGSLTLLRKLVQHNLSVFSSLSLHVKIMFIWRSDNSSIEQWLWS